MTLNSETYEQLGYFFLGRHLDDENRALLYDSRGLLTHGVCVGMTGSGKTGLCLGLLEEAAMDGIPAIAIDPKGDIGNLLLTFPNLAPSDFLPWVDASEAERSGLSVEQLAERKATQWKTGLESWGQGPERIQRLREKSDIALYTPGSTAGKQVSLLSSFKAPPADVLQRTDVFADRVESTVSGILGLLGMDADPLQSAEHVFLSQIFMNAWRQGQDMDLVSIIQALQNPPFERVGVMHVDDVLPQRARMNVAMRLNNLVASPSFASWLDGDAMDIEKFLYTPEGKPRIAIFSINHLGDAERMFFVTLLLDRVLGWMRAQAGTTSLRALVYMDEVFGYLPPVANPPSKKPLLTMLKQARAHGLGLVLATQNPADLDYKALSNAGTWFLGRLQTDRDITRVMEGLQASGDIPRGELEAQLKALRSRQFVLHSVHRGEPEVFETRWVMSYLKGPLTREDIQRLNQHDTTARSQAAEAAQLSPAPTPITAPSATPVSHAVLPLDGAYYLPVQVPQPEHASLTYRPMLFGAANLHTSNSTMRLCRIVGFQAPPVLLDWTRSNSVEFGPEIMAQTPAVGAHFLEAPREAQDARTQKSWTSAFEDLLLRETKNTTYSCPALKLKSEAGESVESFHQRVHETLRIRRDAEIDKLHESYDKKIRTEQDQVERAKDKLEREQAEHRDSKMMSAVNVGSSLLSAFTGRSRSVSSAVRQTANAASRTQRAAEDVQRAAAALQKEMDDVQRVRNELEEKLRDVGQKWDVSQYPVQNHETPVRKQDLNVQFVGLVYVPYWVRPTGERLRAF